jgi:hypothetical protein
VAELREHLRAVVDAVLVRKANGHGPASDVSARTLVLFHGDAPAVLLSGSRGPITRWEWDGDASSLRAA